jgi:hypothetical protein
MKDAEHPFFRPLWRRIALIAFCAAWSVFEFATGSAFWGTLAGGMAAYAGWTFLVNYPPPSATGENKPAANPPPAEKE